jgi:hypothetical protein
MRRVSAAPPRAASGAKAHRKRAFFLGGLLHLPVAAGKSAKPHLALLVFSFVAGFSERWAQDTLTSVVPSAREKKQTS